MTVLLFRYFGEKKIEKIFIISFDDSTVWDVRLAEMLTRYGIPGTFNLNSGLEDFVWEFRGRPVCRQVLTGNMDHYRGHEVASHTCTHPWLTSLTPPRLRREVEEDCRRIREIFSLDRIGFAVPFTGCTDREIRLIAPYVRYIRLSEYANDFSFPKDPYRIPIHALYNDPDVEEKIHAFARSAESGLFVLAGHSYELEFLDHWELLENILKTVKSLGFTCMTTMDFVDRFYPEEE